MVLQTIKNRLSTVGVAPVIQKLHKSLLLHLGAVATIAFARVHCRKETQIAN